MYQPNKALGGFTYPMLPDLRLTVDTICLSMALKHDQAIFAG